MPDRVLTEDVRRLIDGPNVAHMATVSSDGAPHVVPVWVGRDDDEIVMVKVDGAAGLANIERDPRVAFSVIERGNQYVSAHLRGTVTAIERSDAARQLLERLARAYTGSGYPDRPTEVVLVRVQPTRVSFNRIAGFDDTTGR